MSEQKAGQSPAAAARAALRLMDDFLDVIDPANREIVDSRGNKYEIPQEVSGRRELRVLRQFEKMVSRLDDLGAGTASWGQVARAAIKDDEAIECLCEAFRQAFPEVLTQAITRKPGSVLPENLSTVDPLEIFRIGEVVGALGPFIAATVRTLIQPLLDDPEETDPKSST